MTARIAHRPCARRPPLRPWAALPWRRGRGRPIVAALALLALAGCGGGGGGGTPGIGGTVSGLQGSGLVLGVNGQAVALAAGSSRFEGPAATDGSVTLTVTTQPTAPVQVCTAQATPPAIDCATPTELLLAAGSTTRAIRLLAVHPDTGALTALPDAGLALPSDTVPSALAVAANGRHAYVLHHRGIAAAGNVQALRIDSATGSVSALGSGTWAVGAQPAGVALHPSGRWLYVSAQDGLHAFAVDSTTGGLTRLAGSPFAIPADAGRLAITPDGRFAYLNDAVGRRIHLRALDASTGVPTALTGSPVDAGIQPGPLAVHPSGRQAYSADTALDGRGRVGAWAVDASTGALSALSGHPFTLAAANASLGEGPAQVLVSPAGDRLWAWGWQALRPARIDTTTGALSAAPATAPSTLTLSAVGTLATSATGRFLFDALPCCVYGSGIAALTVDGTTGALAPAAGSPFTAWPASHVLAAVPVVR